MISSTLSKFLRISNQGTEGLEEEAFFNYVYVIHGFSKQL